MSFIEANDGNISDLNEDSSNTEVDPEKRFMALKRIKALLKKSFIQFLRHPT